MEKLNPPADRRQNIPPREVARVGIVRICFHAVQVQPVGEHVIVMDNAVQYQQRKAAGDASADFEILAAAVREESRPAIENRAGI
jgi:hypothetical protein